MTLTECLSSYLDSNSSKAKNTVKTFPYFTAGDRWLTLSDTEWDDWTAGFWTGIHWMGTELGVIGQSRALDLTRRVKPIHEQNINVGFRYEYSWVPAFEVTGNPNFKRRALKGAERLSRCYFPELSLVGSELDDGATVLVANDALMNVPLLLWAINYTPESGEYRKYLKNFLAKASRLFVKPNGAVRHCIHYDPESRSIKRVRSPQGVPGGCWSRGLAWTVYGLTLGGIFLNNEKFIETAKRAMDYHCEHSYNLIPPFDYSVSTINRPELTDTSAAAILASAMLTLGKVRKNHQAERLGERITRRLFNKFRRSSDQDGLIDGGCFHYPEGDGVNEATVWGDFYALEARYMMEENGLPPHLNWLTAKPLKRAKAS